MSSSFYQFRVANWALVRVREPAETSLAVLALLTQLHLSAAKVINFTPSKPKNNLPMGTLVKKNRPTCLFSQFSRRANTKPETPRHLLIPSHCVGESVLPRLAVKGTRFLPLYWHISVTNSGHVEFWRETCLSFATLFKTGADFSQKVLLFHGLQAGEWSIKHAARSSMLCHKYHVFSVTSGTAPHSKNKTCPFN